MNRPVSPEEGAVFELTVEGELGPVFRSALRPRRVAEAWACTIFRITAGAGSYLIDLVKLLDSEGLTIESIYLIEAPAGG